MIVAIAWGKFNASAENLTRGGLECDLLPGEVGGG